MKPTKYEALAAIWSILGVVYAPIYIAAFLLHRVGLLILSIAYFFGLRWNLAKGCFKQVFKYEKDDERQPKAPRTYW